MDNQQKLTAYISEQLRQSQTPDVIANQLAQAGWPPEQVQQAFAAVQAQVVPTTMQPQQGMSQPAGPAPAADGSLKGSIKVGFRILIHCAKLLNSNRFLLRYFLMTWVFIILINAAAFAFIMTVSSDFLDSNTTMYPFIFLLYLVTYCVVNFYAAALARNILDIYKGERQSYATYISAARAKFLPIFVYSLISAVVGIVIEYLIERFGWLGRIVGWLIGTAWSVGNMFTLPIIMDTNSSATTAIKQSFGMLKQTWGVGITAKVTTATPIFILQILLAFAFVPFAIMGASAGGFFGMLAVVSTYIWLSISLAVIGTYASNFINAALYYYAINKQVPPGFDADMLNQILVKKK